MRIKFPITMDKGLVMNSGEDLNFKTFMGNRDQRNHLGLIRDMDANKSRTPVVFVTGTGCCERHERH